MGQRRSGFTLVEVTVSMALILFTMVIVSEAFVTGLESFRQLKATGDLCGQVRKAVSVLRDDLRADHFGTGLPVSRQPMPPPAGFFRVWHGRCNYSVEGYDANGVPCRRVNDHLLHFTLKRTGNRRENFFPAIVNAGGYASPLASAGPAAYQDGATFHSQWAEVAYFLRPTSDSTSGDVPMPLYSLYRRHRVVVTAAACDNNGWNGGNRIPVSQLSSYADISCQEDPDQSGSIYLNGEDDLTMPIRRFGMKALQQPDDDDLDQPEHSGLPDTQPDGTTSYPKFSDDPSQQARFGSDLLITNVVSFDVMVSSGGDFVDLSNFDGSSSDNTNPAFSAANGPRVFDTWTDQKKGKHNYGKSKGQKGHFKDQPLATTLQAVQIRLRVWDPKTQRTQQVTLLQDL